ncbi:hypothetical protein PCURB6_12240 [Paenibacillus curdlanolyticus]|nr:hypothetical protein PCURB6_12240 [Paenibacillus curdlanolyticus]
MKGPKPGSNKYGHYVQRYTVDCLWGESDETVAISEMLRRGVINNDRHTSIRYTNEFMKNMDALTFAQRCKQATIVELLDR